MEQPKEKYSRKGFVLWGLGIAASFSALRLASSAKKEESATPTTIKMLNQEGQLVEVDISRLPAKREKISDADLKTFVKR